MKRIALPNTAWKLAVSAVALLAAALLPGEVGFAIKPMTTGEHGTSGYGFFRNADRRPDEVAQLENAIHQIGLDLHALAAADLKLALAASQNHIHSLQDTISLLRPAAVRSTSLHE